MKPVEIEWRVTQESHDDIQSNLQNIVGGDLEQALWVQQWYNIH